jgi:hypothetical protein
LNVILAALEVSENEVQQLSMALVQMGEEMQSLKLSHNSGPGYSIPPGSSLDLVNNNIADMEVICFAILREWTY